MRAVVDTNILVDYLNGVDLARAELARYAEPGISVITWMEVLVGASPTEEATLRSFLGRYEVVPLSAPIAEQAVVLRRKHRLRLPDAIIWSTALVNDRILVTRNEKDFPRDHPSIRVPYRLAAPARP
jgi:hypothetical protein